MAGLRTKRDAENAIRRDLVPPWRGRSITSITKHDVVEVIEDIISRRGTPGGVCYAAHHSLAYAKKLFAWAAARNYGVENNPCDKIKPGELIGAKAKRKRVLTDDEIRLLWKVTGDITYPLGPLVRMLLVTGQRLREIAHGEWREVNLDEAVWTIPGSIRPTICTGTGTRSAAASSCGPTGFSRSWSRRPRPSCRSGRRNSEFRHVRDLLTGTG